MGAIGLGFDFGIWGLEVQDARWTGMNGGVSDLGYGVRVWDTHLQMDHRFRSLGF
jgi:hypothetical protein